MSASERTQRTNLLRGPVTDIPGLTTYLSSTYQEILVSGTNIKTINGQSVLGAGDIVVGIGSEVDGGSPSSTYTDSIDGGTP